jgi:predicted secreted hydrolase
MISRARWPAFAALLLAPLLCAAAWRYARPGYLWSFPQDHWAHPDYRTEWWYFTGILADRDHPARRFGYQFTVFRVGLTPDRPVLESRWAARGLLMGHAALGDFAAGEHRFSDLLYREIPMLARFGEYPEARIAWSLAPPGTGAAWQLSWNGKGFDLRMDDAARGIALELSTRPAKPLVLQGPGGLSRKGTEALSASYYYSFPRLDTEGSVSIDHTRHAVRGTSWMDKEFSTSQLQRDQTGWDWFGLRLDDGRDLMLYVLRGRENAADFRKATLVTPDGEARYLEEKDWSIRASGSWLSPHTGTRYPARWILEIPAQRLRVDIVPLLADQENVGLRSARLHYWEGAVRLAGPDGSPLGEGYVELTGYGAKNRPPL